MKEFTKDPDAVLDYVVDWSPDTDPWLASGETIASHVVDAEAGITVDSSTVSDGKVTVWLSGGTAGQNYDVGVQITTSSNRTDERTMRIRVRER